MNNDGEMHEMARIVACRASADLLRSKRAALVDRLLVLREKPLDFLRVALKIESIDAEIERTGQ